MKNLKFNSRLFFVAVILFASTLSKAQEGKNNVEKKQMTQPSVKEIFKMMDKNNDEKISTSEAEGPIKHDFSIIDTNKDGFITKVELKKGPKPKGPKPSLK